MQKFKCICVYWESNDSRSKLKDQVITLINMSKSALFNILSIFYILIITFFNTLFNLIILFFLKNSEKII